MLQIKNTLGGGKPEGLYAWKKNEVEYTSQNELDSDNMILIDNSSASAVRIYYSTSYSFDASTGLYTLNNPIASDVSYGKTKTINGGNYVTLDSPSSPTMYTNNSTSYTFYVDNGASANREIMIAPNSTKDKLKTYSAKANFTFIDYIVSDKETAYPDGAVHTDGYWYEKVVDSLDSMGFNKYSVDEYVPTSNQAPTQYYMGYYGHTFNHSLGEVPKFAILLCPYLMTAQVYGNTQFIVSAVTGISAPGTSGWIGFCNFVYTGTSATSRFGGNNISDVNDVAYTDKRITFVLNNSGNIKLSNGKKYILITVA